MRSGGATSGCARSSRSDSRAASIDTFTCGRNCVRPAMYACAISASPGSRPGRARRARRTSSLRAAWPLIPSTMPYSASASGRAVRSGSGTAASHWATEAACPRSYTSRPLERIRSIARSHDRACSRHSIAEATSPWVEEPLRGRGDDAHLLVGETRAQPIAQQIAEQVVEAEPLVLVVDRDEEHRVAFQLVEEPRGIGNARAPTPPGSVTSDRAPRAAAERLGARRTARPAPPR